MNYDVTYSLRMALETEVPELTDVVIMRDDVDLTTREKPFATVEYLQGGGTQAAAGRESYVDEYSFQIGLFAEDVNERFRLEAKIREKVIRAKYGFPLYRFNGTAFGLTDENVLLTDGGFTPISNDDNSNQTNSNRGYFDATAVFY